MQSDVVNRSYCTHECVRGLAFGTPLDKNCPNVKDHSSKHIDRQEFLRLIRDQLDGENAHANCKPINASGHIGHLFKIHLLSHGYTLVTKAVGLCDGASLLHEEKMYNHLRDLQGRFIPACPGHVELKRLFRGEAYDNTAFRHFLFLSYAGKPVLKALSKVDYSVVRQVLEALVQLHQRRVMHRDAAPRNMLYNARTGKYMVIDLELSEPIDGGVPEAVDVHIQKGKRKGEDDRESEPFATESKALFSVRGHNHFFSHGIDRIPFHDGMNSTQVDKKANEPNYIIPEGHHQPALVWLWPSTAGRGAWLGHVV
ncbi:hypothetical protein E4U58_005856 [Claviceps cyperi]|nr:hypothetical protein E4U58_005856 [Claviceps cyperi]